MNDNVKSPTSPDSVLSLVVFVISIFLIMSAAFLYYFQTNVSYAGANISSVADWVVGRLQMDRQQAVEIPDLQ